MSTRTIASPMSCSSCLRAFTTDGSLDGWGEAAKTTTAHTHTARAAAMSFFICCISYSPGRDPSIGGGSELTQTVYCTELAIRCMNVLDQPPTACAGAF